MKILQKSKKYKYSFRLTEIENMLARTQIIKKKCKEILKVVKKNYQMDCYSIKKNEEHWKWKICNQM